MIRTLFALLLSVAGLQAAQPNFLLILADDLGWSDLGCYGGEIQTPNLDALAKGGLRFTQFYNSARCSPTRASILTGVHPHQAGFPNLSGVLPAECATIPEALQGAGYHSYMSGKWHLSEKSKPTDRGFEEFYGMLGGFNTYWKESPHYTRWPAGREKRPYAEGQFYSTDAFGDYAIDFIQQGKQAGKPWFLYLAFNAPHFPLHAPAKEIAKYEAVYAQGWDVIRAQRLARMQQLGLVPKSLKLTPRSRVPGNQFNWKTGWAELEIPAWDALAPERRADLARRMAVYAAAVDRLDQNIGRVVDHLKQSGQLENTVIFFLSDNGACAEWDPWGFDGYSGPTNSLHQGAELATIGGPDSYISYGSGWANVCNTPWRLFKHYGHEGGTRAPFIVHWPAGLRAKPGSLATQPGYITDFMPTICELAGAAYPKERNGKAILPMEGASLVPALAGQRSPERTICIEHEGNRSVREGDWKLVALADKPWELYNMSRDPSEMNNLAARQPARVKRMADAWDDWAARCKVKLHVQDNPQVAKRPLTITCEVEPTGTDGVILAQGGRQNGYALHLAQGKPVFSVRIQGNLVSITAQQVLKGKMSLEARLAEDGRMTLSVGGKVVAQGQAAGLLPVQPADELSIGQDTQSAVGDYTAPHPLTGKVDKVKVLTE